MASRILFMGTPDFAVPSLQALVREGYEVTGVVTQPDRPRGRKRKPASPPVKKAALELGLTVFQPEKLRDPASVAKVLDSHPDLIVTAAYGQLLPPEVLQAPPFGCVNVHASLLPKYRGGAPIHHALIAGEKETGVTIMYMVQALDAGDILTQRSLPIEEDDDVGTLHDKLSHLGADLLVNMLPDLLQGRINPVPQDPEQATYAPNIKREDEKIDWTHPVEAIYNQVRGLSPWPVAFTTWKEKPLKIWRAKVSEIDAKDADPGTVLQADSQGVVVAASDGALTVTELQPAGKKAMSAEEFVRGRNLVPGDRLGDG
ncbi:methionyl-tRNA formyltransferase [Paludifilum halophilum]|uniref:Methionyl-tRNA formyltransferase n=1 Tax=Paludifilum halophilum TaxID=1642702 RepID=A0A235B293_9BACL|nr:methionyl-tRNA formyltransferase [Paludifilum halophilum]OYD06413.1 methionyl-tRNA formyltransferase [Paludifilum halophilum]